MTARRPLPTIAPCPCGELRCGLVERTHADTGKLVGYFVRSECGWIGPIRKTKAGAIIAWNRRSDADTAKFKSIAKGWQDRSVAQAKVIDKLICERAEAELRLRKLAELWATVEATPVLKDGSSAPWTHEFLAFEREIKKLCGEVLPAKAKKGKSR